MAAPRSTSLKALRSLSQQPCRSLHITGAYSAQVATGPDASTLYHSRTLADLRAECQKRNLGASGSKSEVSSARFSCSCSFVPQNIDRCPANIPSSLLTASQTTMFSSLVHSALQ